MKHTLVVLSIILAPTRVLLANEQNRQTRTDGALDAAQQNKKEWNDLKKRFTEHSDFLNNLQIPSILARFGTRPDSILMLKA